MIRGYRFTSTDPVKVRVCPRCGCAREARKSTALCRDCTHVLTAEQRQVWAA